MSKPVRTQTNRAAPAKQTPRWLLAAAVVGAIVYGSLYPFHFRDPGTLAQDFLHLASTWKSPPQSRGDFLANLLLYAPLGLALSLVLGDRRSRISASVLAVLAGTLLSVMVELAQFYDDGRFSALSDVYLNATGTLIGVVFARIAGFGPARQWWPSGSMPGFARLLLLAWLGWRLYPYAPTISLAKYWHSIRPLLFAPGPAPLEIFRFGVFWLSVFFLLQTAFQPKKGFWLFLPAALFYFAAKILIVGQNLSLGEILGALAALVLSPLVMPRYGRFGIPVVAGLLMTAIIMTRLLPWRLAAKVSAFQWIPFYGFLHGSLQFDVIAFSQKFYLYGAMLLLLLRAGMGLKSAVALLCAVLLATSLMQMFLMDRSAEITDALLALSVGLIYALMARLSSGTAAAARTG
jgi:VanZ family protein